MSHVMNRRALALLASATLAGCASPRSQESAAQQGASSTTSTSTLTAEERSAGWRPLFDGSTLAGWHAYHGTGTPTGWRAADGLLTRVGGGGDLVTDEQYANFELALDWNVAPGSNSGIIYRITDAGEATYMTGPEYQVLDDARHPDGKSPLTSAAAVYGLYPTPRGIVKPAGEWNAARLVVNGNHVEHWLNGVRVAQYELGSPEWSQKVAASKFAQWPGYGKSPRGRIGLQDHGDSVSFRNIRIKVLP
jgi:Domain of Unknown Function (DUF1080)